MPAHQARATQMSLPTGCRSNRALIVLTIEVTGWFSAKARTGPGIEAVGTNAEMAHIPGWLRRGWPAGQRGEGAPDPDRWGQGPPDPASEGVSWGQGPLHPRTGVVRGYCWFL